MKAPRNGIIRIGMEVILKNFTIRYESQLIISSPLKSIYTLIGIVSEFIIMFEKSFNYLTTQKFLYKDIGIMSTMSKKR
jgi:hypothetical protein